MPHKIFFCFLLLISLAFGANDDAREIGKAVSDIEHLQKNYEKLDGKIDEMEKNQKSVEEYKNIIDRQDKRIDEITIGFAALSIFIALAAIAASLFGVSKVRRDAKEATEKWLEDNAAKKISDKLKEFDDDVKSKISYADIVIDKKMKEIEEDIKQRIDAIYKDYKKVMKLFEEVRKANGDKKRLDEVQADESTIDEALRQAEARAKSTNSYSDWSEAAMLALKRKNYENAIVFWDKAIATTDDYTLKARCRLNKGVTLGEKGETEEAIKIYDELYEEFRASQKEEIRVVIAAALANKGLALWQQGDNKGAKEQYLKSIEFNPSYLGTYTSLFELWLIMGDEFDEKIVSQFLENARDDKQELLGYEAIATLKASLLSDQSEKIKELKDKYSGVGFGDWSWKELEAWAQDMADGAAGDRVLGAISEFKRFE